MKKALILGITGQDGSYLADILHARNYDVHGMVRHTSQGNLHRISHLTGEISLYSGDMLDPQSVERIIREVQPDEIYNEADQDNVDFSYRTPAFSADITYAAVVRLLESIRTINPKIRLFQPVSATMFGCAKPPQNEQTPFHPQSPYACSKLAAYYACQHYRREHGLFVTTGIMFNHDSPRRGDGYLLHKIARQAVKIKRGELGMMLLPVLDMEVDIGHAREYMEVVHKLMQQDVPGDYVVATGRGYRIRDLAGMALEATGVTPFNEHHNMIQVDESLRRVGSQPTLLGDCYRVKHELGWKPEHDAASLVRLLVNHTLEKMGKSCG